MSLFQNKNFIDKESLNKKKSFDYLILKYQYRILKLIKIYVTDEHESLDLRQDIFFKAYKNLEHFRGESSFYTWLYKIAINTVKSYLVEKNKRLEYSLESLNLNQFYMFKDAESLEDTINNSIELEESIQNLNIAIKKLPFILQNTILLRELNELSYEEISTVMKCPIGTVRSRIFRAKEALEKHIKR